MAGWCAIFVEKDENLPSDAVGSKEISLLTKNNPKNKIFDHIVMADLRHLTIIFECHSIQNNESFSDFGSTPFL